MLVHKVSRHLTQLCRDPPGWPTACRLHPRHFFKQTTLRGNCPLGRFGSKASRAKCHGRYLLVLPDMLPLSPGFVQSLVVPGPVPVVPWPIEPLFIELFPVESLPLEQWILDTPAVGDAPGPLW
jgi:hypothetical protein